VVARTLPGVFTTHYSRIRTGKELLAVLRYSSIATTQKYVASTAVSAAA
jgi:hypothetical protein